MKENGLKLAKERSRRNTTQIIANADYADGMVLLPNSPTQPEILLRRLERAARGIGIHVNAAKTEYVCFNQRADISTLIGGPQKIADMFYLTSHQTTMTLTRD